MENDCLDTHLNSPLSLTITRECWDHIAHNTNNYRNHMIKMKTTSMRHLLQHLNLDMNQVRWDKDIQSKIGDMFSITNTSVLTTNTINNFDKYWNTLLSYVPYNLLQLDTGMGIQDYKSIFNKLIDMKEHREILHIYMLRNFLEAGVVLSAKPEDTLDPDGKDQFEKWNSVRMTGSKYWIHTGTMISSSGVFSISVTRNHCLITIQNETYLLDRNYLLLLSDLTSQRFLCYLAAQLAQILKRPNYPTFDDLTVLFSLGDKFTREFGNKGYNSLSLWESLIISEVLLREEDVAVDNSKFRQNITKEFIQSQEEKDEQYLSDLLELTIIPWIRSIPITCIFQLFGLYRIWGHPTVNEIEAVNKLKSIACSPRTVNFIQINLITCKWREYFCLSYFKKHGKWPALKIKDHAPNSVLIKALKDNIFIHTKQTGYDIHDWSYIEFLKNFNIPEKLELSEVIADKATSLSLKDLIAWCMSSGTIGPAELRSVIIQWLDTNYNNPEEFLQKINDEGFPEGETVVGLHPKERELKIFARLFGLLTIGKRLYVVLTEALLASNVFPYFPEITMTYDAVTLQNKIHHNTRNTVPYKQGKKNNYTVITNIDFVKWNSNMRFEETFPLFQDFDHLHGMTKLFVRTHEMFENSIMYLADGTITPFDRQGSLINHPAVWSNHIGGIEGLRQKGWTIFTVVILKYVAEQFDVECQLMGQGDNQVLVLNYIAETKSELQSMHSKFILALSKFLDTIGPPMKVEETWSSSHFFIYGKYPVYQGVPMSMSLKKICRAMRLTNDKLQNLESTCSSITANSSAATLSDHDPIISYILGSFETLGAIDLHMTKPFFLKKAIRVNRFDKFLVPSNGVSLPIFMKLDDYSRTLIYEMSMKCLASLAVFPCILGGLPTLQLTDLVNHGFPDPLSLSLWGLKFLYNNLPDSHSLRPIIINMVNPIFSSDRNQEMICEDPASINILRCSSASEKVKRLVFNFLASDLPIRNSVFKEFLILAKQGQTELCSILITMKPFNPRVANSLLSATISGRALQIVSKVNKTGTLIGMMKKHKENWKRIWLIENEGYDESDSEFLSRKSFNFREQFGKFEENYLKSVLYQLFQPRSREHNTMVYCSTRYAQHLREKSWFLPITGVTVAVPQEMCKIYSFIGTGCNPEKHPNISQGYFRLISCIPGSFYYDRDTSPHRLALGPFTPFFGTTTKNKIKYEGGELKSVAPALLQGSLDLLCLIGWGTETNSHFTELIKMIFGSMTDLDSNLCIPSVSTISGTVEHRWQDKRTSHSSTISVLYHLPSYLNITPNNFKPQDSDNNTESDNFNISFQSIYTWLSSLYAASLITPGHDWDKCKHVHIDCTSCVVPIYEGYLEIDELSDHQRDLFTPKIDNPYCWVSKESLLINLKTNPTSFLQTLSSIDEVDDPDDLFYRSLCDFYFSEFPIPPIGQSFIPSIHSSSSLIPINICPYIDVYTFLKHLICYRIVEYLLHQAKNVIRHVHLTNESLFSDALSVIMKTPAIWYRGMSSLLMNLSSWNRLREFLPTLSLPTGSPPSDYEVWSFFRRTIEGFILTHMNVSVFKQWCLNSLLKIHPLSKKIIMSPILHVVAYNVFQESNQLVDPTSLAVLVLIRDIYCNHRSQYSINSNSDFWSLSMSSTSSVIMDVASNRLKHIQTVIKSRKNVKFLQVIPESIIKTLKRRVNVGGLLTLSNQPDLYANKIIHLSTIKTSHETLISSSIKNSSFLGKQLVIYPSPYELKNITTSYLNHFYKGFSPSTSASYKIVSILKSIETWIERERSITDGKRVAIFGDGVGGYTLTCGRIFYKSELFFNTLCNLENLPSNGVNHYVPIAVSMLPSVFNRLINLNFTTEVASDVSDKQFYVDFTNLKINPNIIISDIEGDTRRDPTRSIITTENLLKIVVLSNSSDILIIKAFMARLDIIYTQYLMLCNVFKFVKITRSYYSNCGNTEVFLIGYLKQHLPMPATVEIIPFETMTGPCKKMRVNSWVSPPVEFRDFCNKVLKFMPSLHKTAYLSSKEYSRVLEFRELTASKIEQFNIKLRIMQGKSKKFIFPSTLIRSWRKEFQLVKFSHKTATRWRPSFLTTSLMRSILYQYILFLFILYYDPTYHNLQCKIFEDFIGCFYETVDSSWGLCLVSNDSPRMGQNKKLAYLKDIMRPDDIKSIIRDAALLRDSIKPQIRSLIPSITLPYTPFPVFIGEWWKDIHVDSVSPLLMPRGMFDHFISKRKILLPPIKNIIMLDSCVLDEISGFIQEMKEGEVILPNDTKQFWTYQLESRNFSHCYKTISFANIPTIIGSLDL